MSMTSGEISLHQAITGFWDTRTVNPVFKEPQDNLYGGRFKVLPRTDGLYVVRDLEQWPPAGAVFRTLEEARADASSKAKLRTVLASKV